MTEERQGLFDFESGNAQGLENWRREQEDQLDAIREEWALPIGKYVRICVWNPNTVFVGKLRLVQMPVSIDHHVPLRLQVNKIEFSIPDIIWLVVN